MDKHDQKLSFFAGWALSLLFHALLVGVLAGWEAAASFPAPADDLPAPDSRVRLGIQNSEASTITWLGYEDPTPHEAQQGVIDQAEFARGEESTGGGADPGQAPQQTIQATAEPAVEETVAQPLESILAETPESDDALAVAESEEVVAESPAEIAPEEATPKPEEVTPDPQETPVLPEEVADSTDGQAGQTEGQQPQDGVTGEDAGDGDPLSDAGNADRESPATAKKPPVKIEPGKPAAAEGLEIKTVRPRFTHMTTLTSRPKNPIVKVTFDATGRVVLASFTRRTGTRDVDEPLLDAIYQWRAKGKAITELKNAESPTLEIEFEIVLRR